MTVLAWHNDPALKTHVMARLRQHRADDGFIQSLYQMYAPEKALGYRGCALGCTLPKQPPEACSVEGCTYDHPPADPRGGWSAEIERQYGIRALVTAWIDTIFEMLPPSGAGDFAVEVIEAIPVGADLSAIDPKYQIDGWDAAQSAAAALIADLAGAPVPAMTS